MATMTIVAQVVWTGLATSTYYVLFAVAFALVLKVMKIWNFAQAGLMAVAFYTMFWAFNGLVLPVSLAIALGLAVTIGVALALERYGFQTLRRRQSSSMTFFIFTLIFSEFAAYLLTLLFGTEPLTLFPSIMSPVSVVAGIAVSRWDLTAVGVTLVLTASLYTFLRFSRQGQFLVAVSDNSDLAELYGISTRRSFAVGMAAAALFITAGMYLFGSKLAVHPNLPLGIMLFAVTATILGGIGNVFGAALAAVLLNLLQSLSVLVLPSRWQGLMLYLFLFLIILFLPRGLSLPRRRRALGVRSADDLGSGGQTGEAQAG